MVGMDLLRAAVRRLVSRRRACGGGAVDERRGEWLSTGLEEDEDPRKGLDFQGVYMIKGGRVSRIIDDIPNPNGLALSPDEKILYANGSRDKYVRRYRVLPDDTVTDSRMFIDISGDKTPGITDGLKVDIKGNVWESAAGGGWIGSREGNERGRMLCPELVANVEFGDPDHKTLYIAARTSIYKIRVNIAGVP